MFTKINEVNFYENIFGGYYVSHKNVIAVGQQSFSHDNIPSRCRCIQCCRPEDPCLAVMHPVAPHTSQVRLLGRTLSVLHLQGS